MSKRYLGFICILYSLIICYLLVTGILSNFLAPNMHMYTVFSAIILFVMGLVILFKVDNHYSFKITDLILLLPLIMVIIAGDGRLSTSIASNRTNNFNKIKAEEKSEQMDDKVKEEPITEVDTNYDFSTIDFNITDQSYITMSDGITYNSKPDKLVGKTIRVRGFSLLKGTYIPKGYFSIGKYLVSCCTADAGFGGFIVRYNNMKSIKDDKWYEIEGVLEKGKDSLGNDIVVINAINVKKINSKKEEVYVYPCYSYGDDGCKILESYDFDF